MTGSVPIADRIEWWPRGNLRPNPRNARDHSAEQLAELSDMMRLVWTYPVLVAEDADNPQHGMIMAGHGRYEAAPGAGYHDTVKVLVAEGWSAEMIERYTLFDNQIALNASWDDAKLVEALNYMKVEFGAGSIGGLGFTQDQVDALLNPKPVRSGVKGSLADAFGVPPFSVLIAREGWWQNRKKLWLGLGIQSELGRADHTTGTKGHKAAPGGGGRLYGGRREDGSFGQNTSYGKAK